MSPAARESVITVRVNYSETDQMGVVYHARYVVWLDMARTENVSRRGPRLAKTQDPSNTTCETGISGKTPVRWRL